jgi:hypothetical protein
MELSFVEEEIPKISRPGGSGREPEPWENHLAPLKAKEGTSFRVWTYTKRSSAMSRMTAVRNRLTKAVPYENWKMAVRSIPDDPNLFGVYVTYNGIFTQEQVQENAAAHAQRSARVLASREKANATRNANAAAANGSVTEPEPAPAPEPSEPTEPEPSEPTSAPSAKDRVAAARAARG